MHSQINKALAQQWGQRSISRLRGKRRETGSCPGHTPGCISLYCDGALFVGDILFMDSIGRLDFPGGDVAAMMSSLQRLIKFPSDTQVFSGHGPDTTIGREIAHNPYLR